MQDQQITPGMNFKELLNSQVPQAMAWVTGQTAYPDISGIVRFYPTAYGGVLIEAEFFNLPNINTPGSSDFYAFHIHEYGDCGNNFANAGEHYNPSGLPHPYHAGDMPPLMGNQGYAWMTFYDKRFTIEDIIGRSVIVHRRADNFTTQPSGNSGAEIACGVIRPFS
ncbi:superoxide dismutase family protein [Lachnospiraceae bacterium 54-53]